MNGFSDWIALILGWRAVVLPSSGNTGSRYIVTAAQVFVTGAVRV